MPTGKAGGAAPRKGSGPGRGADSGASEYQRRIENLTRPVKLGRGKILTMRQLRKMNSIVARRVFKDATSADLPPRDRKQGAIGLGVATDKLIALAPHDKRQVVEHDGSPEILEAIRELGARISAIAQQKR